MTTLRNLNGDATFDDDYPNLRTEWDADNLNAAVILTENLRFHSEFLGRTITAAEVTESEEFSQLLAELTPERFESAVEMSDADDDEGYENIEILMWRDLTGSPDMPLAEAEEQMVPAEVTLINITDPGTFGSPYLFSAIH